MKRKNRKQLEKPLTLEALVDYNQKVLFPFLAETFVTKKEFSHLDGKFSKHIIEDKDSKNKIMTSLDKILKQMDTLVIEKTVRDFQHKKEKQFYVIIVKALKEHNILGSRQLQQISELEIF